MGSAGRGGTGGGAAGNTGVAGQGGSQGGSSGQGGKGGQAGSQGGSSGQGGKGGQAGSQGGSSGQGGKGGQAGGQGGAGGGDCPAWETNYAKALMQARACNLSSLVPQCTQMVSSKLACGCPTYVNDKTQLDMIRSDWLQSGCSANVICPPIACLVPPPAGCVPMNSGDFCSSVVASTN
jgi:hypothetical protein